jgi:hypothetical protein
MEFYTFLFAVHDTASISDEVQIEIEVTPVNDAPVIVDVISQISTPINTPIEITLSDILVSDPDNVYPDDFSLELLDGEYYSLSKNLVRPDSQYTGILNIPIKVFDGLDSSQVFQLQVEVMGVTSITDRISEDVLLLRPNPVVEYLIVEQTKSHDNYSVMLCDLTGSIVYFEDGVTEDSHDIDMRMLPSGTYILTIANSSQILKSKVVKAE